MAQLKVDYLRHMRRLSAAGTLFGGRSPIEIGGDETGIRHARGDRGHGGARFGGPASDDFVALLDAYLAADAALQGAEGRSAEARPAAAGRRARVARGSSRARRKGRATRRGLVTCCCLMCGGCAERLSSKSKLIALRTARHRHRRFSCAAASASAGGPSAARQRHALAVRTDERAARAHLPLLRPPAARVAPDNLDALRRGLAAAAVGWADDDDVRRGVGRQRSRGGKPRRRVGGDKGAQRGAPSAAASKSSVDTSAVPSPLASQW